jgi:hypothetical protein
VQLCSGNRVRTGCDAEKTSSTGRVTTNSALCDEAVKRIWHSSGRRTEARNSHPLGRWASFDAHSYIYIYIYTYLYIGMT